MSESNKPGGEGSQERPDDSIQPPAENEPTSSKPVFPKNEEVRTYVRLPGRTGEKDENGAI